MVTITNARAAFARLHKAFNKDPWKWEPRKDGKGMQCNVGAWRLDYNPTYGGCIVEEAYNDGGAVTHPFGEGRKSPAEFVACVNFALYALDMDRKAQELSRVS